VGRALAHGIRPQDRIADLPIDQHQVVEILRVIGRDPDIIIFDEATASLDHAQVEAFFALVKSLREQGKAIIFITHRMEEIFAISDRVTVMRNGRSIATRRTADTDRAELVRLMVGEEVSAAPTGAPPPTAGKAVLTVEGLSGPVLLDVSLSLRRGEILGLGGLHGQGQSSLLLSLFGVEPVHRGSILLGDRPIALHNPAAALNQGLAYISGDRGRVGAFAIRSVFENLALVRLRKDRSFVVRHTRLAAYFAPIVERLKIRFASLSAPFASLSGGNQQKVIIGRWLAATPSILLLDDTTKGIDIRAKQDFYALLEELRREGLSVILYSSEDAELLDAADRILVFNNGRIVGELSGSTKTEYELYAAALKSA
jgi:ribose transport system ATP-binding protein